MRRFVGPLLAGAATGAAFAFGVSLLITGAVERQARVHLRIDLARLAEEAAGLDPSASRHEFARAAARRLGARVTWIDAAGMVLADSDVPAEQVPRVESHAQRPEFRTALVGGSGEAQRRSATVGELFLYLAQRLEARPGSPPAVIRIALAQRDLSLVEAPYRRDAVLLGIAGGLLAGAAVGIARRRRDRDVARLAALVDEVARGVAPAAPLEPDLAHIQARLSEMAERTAAVDRAGEGIRLLSRIVFEELPEALLVVDWGLKVLDANPAARRLFASEPVRLPVPLLDFVRNPGIRAAFDVALRERKGSAVQVIVLTEDRADRTLEVAVRPVPGPAAPGAPAAVGLIRDVSDREKLESMRRQFVADVSHELRTPIASIRAAAETAHGELSSPAVPAELVQLVCIIDRQARHLQELVSDLTDLSQIETGAVRLVFERSPAASLLADVVRDLAGPAAARGVTVSLDAPPEVALDGDPRRLAQVFRNLLDNAIKFSPEGGKVLVRARTGASGEAVVAVHDVGCGIPRAAHDRIFQRFFRVDPSRAKTVPGTGLGLAIVKHLLILHGGTVKVDSELGQGSTFTVTLPRRLPGEAAS